MPRQIITAHDATHHNMSNAMSSHVMSCHAMTAPHGVLRISLARGMLSSLSSKAYCRNYRPGDLWARSEAQQSRNFRRTQPGPTRREEKRTPALYLASNMPPRSAPISFLGP